MQSYKARVKAFWDWFKTNESQLEKYLEEVRKNNTEEITEELVSFLASGLNLAIDECMFETGGDHEVSLAVDGSIAMMLLTTYLVNNMPEELQEKWHFTPWKPSFANGVMQIHGKKLDATDIWVAPSRDEDSTSFDLGFYNKELIELEDEDTAYHIFFMLMEMVLGENVSMRYIGDVEMLTELPEAPDFPVIPLSELIPYMDKELAEGEDKFDADVNPAMTYSGYGLDPEDDAPIRFDIIAGFTRLTALLNDYYNDEEAHTFNMLAASGAKAMFLSLPRTDEDHNVDLALRNDLADRLEAEVLGEEDSGSEIGIILGQAIGESNCYIDLLLYDEEAFFAAANKVFKDFNIQISIYDFKPGAEAKIQ